MPLRAPMKDSEVIESFVAFLAVQRGMSIRVDRWPDKERDGDIDAVAGPFAIEHTSIDTFPDQRRDGHGFRRSSAGSRRKRRPRKPFTSPSRTMLSGAART